MKVQKRDLKAEVKRVKPIKVISKTLTRSQKIIKTPKTVRELKDVNADTERGSLSLSITPAVTRMKNSQLTAAALGRSENSSSKAAIKAEAATKRSATNPVRTSVEKIFLSGANRVPKQSLSGDKIKKTKKVPLTDSLSATEVEKRTKQSLSGGTVKKTKKSSLTDSVSVAEVKKSTKSSLSGGIMKKTKKNPLTDALTAAEIKKLTRPSLSSDAIKKTKKVLLNDSLTAAGEKKLNGQSLSGGAVKKTKKIPVTDSHTTAEVEKPIKSSLSGGAIKKTKKVPVCDSLTAAGAEKLTKISLSGGAVKNTKKVLITAAQLKKVEKNNQGAPVIPKKPREKKLKEFDFKGTDWSGNSDDEGSVDFALLDEDLCYECGLDTTDESNWDSLIICDVCDGEYHIACVNLDRIPRNGYTCPRCVKEEFEFSKLKFTVDHHFQIPNKKRKQERSMCYSPSRPLDVAFEECKRKGFMLVSQLFSY
jgi:hypothetical protein